MKPGIHIRPQAQAEIDDHAEFIALDSPDAGRRFLAAIERTFEALLNLPHLGAAWVSRDPRLRGVRRHPVKDFRNHLVFYRPIEEGIEILHVFHGAQNIPRLLDEEDEEGA